ncbi:hypothetical protein H310_12599 [Aphanomyces invadans]|uniref:Uncharacterized protein n=1 Tax=Aphanomyces invadans TaxID=157072 RepID=A0A024TIA0_9STRA|nr:hypothetical protein H310_12599 [Aphanomyces invadans]ETV93311.1 hypothetical protein H310_12599 [Aphanomyces invadans]|eukprot:XP_008877947.1 hypothetical protein H310_12599 [Aphanomyces invadans]
MMARLKRAVADFVGCSEVLFKRLMDTVRIEEMWFYMTRVKRTFYLASTEEPHRQSARPHWDDDTGKWFDGKIGTWHFTEMVPAQRTSRNCPAGTRELKTKIVGKSAYRKMVTDNIGVVEEVDIETLDNNFMTLQSYMQEVIKAVGDNNYKIPHMAKMKFA